MMREFLMIAFTTCSTVASQMLIKKALLVVPRAQFVDRGLAWILTVMTSPWVISAVMIQGLGFVVWVMVVSRMKVGVAFAISGAFFYLLVAAASWRFYGEALAPRQWLGLAIISIGVLVLALPARAG